ncbi:RagB/SusD family nutrient uptake outer membrane protein [Hymenobacter endophyticus]|uniref:RagB/SusD family nutrient uptake outer membrane protein n=1 Tax=Hymenobacter endophyticus TaxID=3076335 RepID=A0ABU3TGS3_9BACT|nr:RagB/SusD family nutrient uptake outer membrane protein [Hymenobacter endophyticus]MDU0370567.1 RagB/SusD family nutrient uptake outer membrane protein [Hymenobacter endophyticus]
MKTFKYLLTLGLTASLGLGTFSCSEDRLEVQPKTDLASEVAFDTPSRVLGQVNNMYDYMKSGSFLGGRYQVYGDIRADDFINRTSNLVTGAAVWQHTLTEASQNDVINLWGSGYAAINQINVFLAGIAANSSKFSAAPFPADYATTANGYVAEGRLLRALAYYSLLQYYARPYADGNGSKPGLPLRLQAETELGNNDLARSTVAQVYDQILTDLTFAETNLPLSNSAGNVFRAHKNAAIALRTRVLLSMGRYGDVVTEANKIVPTAAPFKAPTGVAHELNPSLAAVFAPNPGGTEMIMAFPFTTQDPPGTQNQLAFYFLPNTQGGGQEYSLNPAGVIANTNFKATDARLATLVTRVGTPTAVPYLRKYTNGALSANPYTDAAPVIRYAEVLLNLSESLARTQGATNTRALELLNAVRTRSGSDAYTAASFTGTFSIIDAILLERRLEFLGEGLRNSDDMRLLRPIAGKSTVSAVQPSSTLYIWPIPSSELQTNGAMTRN